MSGRHITNWDCKGWSGSEIQMYYGCPWYLYNQGYLIFSDTKYKIFKNRLNHKFDVFIKSWIISIKIVKVKRVLCNNWPLDGSPKAFHGTVAWRAGPLQGCLAHPDRVHEQSVLACKWHYINLQPWSIRNQRTSNFCPFLLKFFNLFSFLYFNLNIHRTKFTVIF